MGTRQKIIVIISLLICIASISIIGYYLINKDKKAVFKATDETIVSLSPEISSSDACANPLDSTLGNSLYWWNEKYPYYRALNISTASGFDSDNWVSVVINHIGLVEDGKSLPSGNDLRVVARFGEKSYMEVQFNVINPNSIATRVEFEFIPESEIYLYYGDLNAERPTFKNDYTLNSQGSYSASLKSEIVYPIHIDLNRSWALKGYSEDSLALTVSLQENLNLEIPVVNYEIVGTDLSSAIILEGNQITTDVYINDLEPGAYQIQATLSDDCITIRSPKRSFFVSNPLFVAWTMDWEGYITNKNYLDQIDTLSQKYSIPITELFNPRIYLPGAIDQANVDLMTSWLKARQETSGDEVGLHLHMWKDMVQAAGVTPKNAPQWDVMTNGYDVLFSAYNYEESKKIIDWAISKLEENGFSDIKSFRAGGWEMDEDNMHALETSRIKIDSSGRTKHNLGSNLIPSNWNLDITTRPYYPSRLDINKQGADYFNILEIPNNGAESYLYTYEQMRERFDLNHSGRFVAKPTAVTYLSHPHWFNVDYPRLDALFTYTDQFNYEKDLGPVVYVTLDDIHQYWQTNEL